MKVYREQLSRDFMWMRTILFYYENSYVSTGHLDAETVGSENFTDQEQDVMDQYAESASECLEALGASVEIQSQDLEKSGEYYTGEIMYYGNNRRCAADREVLMDRKLFMETHIEMTSLGVRNTSDEWWFMAGERS